MIAATARTYVRAHYVILLAILAIAFGWYALHEHDARIRNETLWQEKYSALDSAWREHDAALAIAKTRTDTVTRTVTRLLASVAADSGWRRDTVRIAGDTMPRFAVPIVSVLRQDSLDLACGLTVTRCHDERIAAERDRDDFKAKLDLALHKPQRSCTTPALITGILGVVGGAYLRGKLP